MLRRIPVFIASTFALLFASSISRAGTKEIGPTDDLKAALTGLQPGDELVLKGGTYEISGYFGVTIEGNQAAPIVIRSKTGEKAHVHRALDDQNILDFVKARYVTFRDIEFSGGSRGLRLQDASFFTIEGCEVHDTGDAAITANDTSAVYESVQILRNHIHDTGGTGEGMYLGCNDNKCRFHHALIAGNHVHHTNGASVTQGDGIEIKEGSHDNVVRDNVIHDTGYPCILTYSVVGNGGPNVLERNVMWGCGDHGIQSAADVVIRNNIILGAAGHAIANQPHQAGTPANIQIVDNTLLAPQNDAIRASGITGSILIANNAVYSQNGNAISVSGTLTGVVVKNNVGEGNLAGVASGLTSGALATDFVAASYSGAVPNDVYPKAGSKLIGAADSASQPNDDFNGTARAGSMDIGAYVYAASGNPGWTLAAGFKPEPTSPGADAGPDGGGTLDGSTTGGDGGPGASNGGPNGGAGDGGANGAAAGNGGDGCGCKTAGAPPGNVAALFAAAAAALAFVRRRKARSA